MRATDSEAMRYAKGPDRGPFAYCRRFHGSGDESFACVWIDDLGGLLLLRPDAAAMGGLLESIAVAVHGQNADVVSESVQQRAS